MYITILFAYKIILFAFKTKDVYNKKDIGRVHNKQGRVHDKSLR